MLMEIVISDLSAIAFQSEILQGAQMYAPA